MSENSQSLIAQPRSKCSATSSSGEVWECPLCGHGADPFAKDRQRAFFLCCECRLIFVDPNSHLDEATERSVYDQHENNSSDERYRQFLNQLAEPLLGRLRPGMQGLDYGCGPGPTLSLMCEEAGMDMWLYDPYYVPESSVLHRQYDFVTCSEVAEHFCNPCRQWQELMQLVRQGGWLAVMTKLWDDCSPFVQWHYKNDPTHVSFYSGRTMTWIASNLQMSIEYQTHNVVLFRKT